MRLKTKLAVVFLTLATLAASGKPMTEAVSSWEGKFVLDQTNILIRADGFAPVKMWLYRLGRGSDGTVVGFSSKDGDMLWSPHPNEKGVQPIFESYAVTFTANGDAEIVVLYSVQGNGGQMVADNYRYDGKTVRLFCSSWFGGKFEPIWRKDH